MFSLGSGGGVVGRQFDVVAWWEPLAVGGLVAVGLFMDVELCADFSELAQTIYSSSVRRRFTVHALLAQEITYKPSHSRPDRRCNMMRHLNRNF